jgi:kinesin family protein 5
LFWEAIHQLTFIYRFEAQLTAVKERLEAAKAGSTRGLSSSDGTGFGFGGSRIAKPLRGGGGGDLNGGPTLPILSGLQSQDTSGGVKRGSWFFDRRS